MKRLFVVQKHHARTLHYDFRIEYTGVLKSWAIPKGLPKISRLKRLAIQVTDHKKSYATFEGEIPKGSYGAGLVELWDQGQYENLTHDESGKKIHVGLGLKKGHLEICLEGKRYKGIYILHRMKENQWLIFKKKS